MVYRRNALSGCIFTLLNETKTGGNNMTTYYRGFKVPSADANSKKTHADKDVTPRLYRGAEYHVDQIAKQKKQWWCLSWS